MCIDINYLNRKTKLYPYTYCKCILQQPGELIEDTQVTLNVQIFILNKFLAVCYNIVPKVVWLVLEVYTIVRIYIYETILFFVDLYYRIAGIFRGQ